MASVLCPVSWELLFADTSGSISSVITLDFNRIVIAVSSGGQHTVMIAKDKVEEEEKEEETNGEGMEVNNGQEANGEAIQEEPVVNGGADENMEEN